MSFNLNDAKELIGIFEIVKVLNDKELIGRIFLNQESGEVIEVFTLKFIFVKSDILFPDVYEVTELIPIRDNRHINPDKSFCLGVRAKQIELMKNGLNFEEFILKILYPFLANQLLLNSGEISKFIGGEHGHGTLGILEHYQEILGLRSVKRIINIIRYVIKNEITRNKKCPCGSKKLIKRCHFDSLTKLVNIGKETLTMDLNQLVSFSKI